VKAVVNKIIPKIMELLSNIMNIETDMFKSEKNVLGIFDRILEILSKCLSYPELVQNVVVFNPLRNFSEDKVIYEFIEKDLN